MRNQWQRIQQERNDALQAQQAVYQPQHATYNIPVAPQVARHLQPQDGCATYMPAHEMPVGTQQRNSAAASARNLLMQWVARQRTGRNPWLLMSALVGAVWFAYMIWMLSRAVSFTGMNGSYEQAVQELRMGISVFMQMPSILSGFVGMIFNWLAWAYGRRSLALTAALLYGAAVMLSFGQSLGYGVFMAVNLLGYVQLEKKKTA